MDTIRGAVTGDNAGAKAGRIIAAVIVFMVIEQLYFHLALIYLIQGIVLGSLYGLIAVALILIYRTNRIINFAAAAIGAIPAIFALLLDVQGELPYLATVPIVLIGGPLFGALVDRFVMRRFAKSPRLITTVVTLGVAQGLAAFGFFIPIWLGAKAGQVPYVPTPWENLKITNAQGMPLLTGNEVSALVTVVVLSIALAALLRFTRIGIALRASAENADRASQLGIPVRRVATVAWMIAGLFGAVAIFVQAPLIGVPGNATLGLDSLLYGLAAAMVARMERISIAMLVGMGVGVILFGSISKEGDDNLASALMLVLILLALLFQRRAMSRADDTGVSTWQAVKHFRPIPTEVRNVREVIVARSALYAFTAIVVLGAPFVMRKPDLNQLIVLPIFGIVAVSLVILTGWAGQISLGQFGLVGVGAAAAGGLVANHNIDFFAAMAIGIGAGVIAAIVVGLPAVRLQGLYLAVTTLAFGFAVPKYILNRNYWIGAHLLPNGLSAHLERPLLYGRFNLDNSRTFYFVCVVGLGLAILAANAFRRNRSGRVVIAARDNQRGAAAYGINIARTRLAAFAVSGGIAGMAGVLLAYAQHNVIPGSYDVGGSVLIFLAVVIGGITSIPAAVTGAILAEASVLFGPRLDPLLGSDITAVLPLLLTGPLLVLNLYFYPGGTAENFFATRDRFLRWVAAKHDILVPSLVADRRIDDTEADHAEDDVILQAEQHVEVVDTFDVHETPPIKVTRR
jgi:branched-chain amino acid transport system permease protein